MLNTRLRKQIEWHFYNCKADLKLHEEKVQDIIDSGLTAQLGHIGRSSMPGSPTESKAIRIEALDHERNWATVIRNTFNAFKFEPEYDIMVALYIKGRRYKELFREGLWETTYWRWRDKWLEYAYKWAKEFKLL